MAEESEDQTAATPTNGNTLSLPNSDSAWNYIWDEKLCKTTLKLFKPTVYTPPILPLPEDSDPKRHYVCPVEGCKKFFAKGCRSQFHVHLKRHLPDSEKSYKCDHPTCTRAFVRYDELAVHKRTHTGEKPYECEQCGKRFTRNHHLNNHLRTHIKRKNITTEPTLEISSEDVGGDDSDTAIDFESDESSSSSLVPTDLDVPVKQEIDTDTDSETDTDEEEHRHETEVIKIEPEKITEPLLPAFYSSDQRVQINETKMEGIGGGDSSIAANNFKFNDTSSCSLAPIKEEVPVKLDISTDTDKYDVPIKLEVPVKQETDTETTFEYDNRFGDFDQYEMKKIKDEPEMIPEPYFPDFYSLPEPTSMSAAIHRLAFPTPIATNNIKSESEHSVNIESESMSAAIHRLVFPTPIVTNNIKPESEHSNNIESEPMSTATHLLAFPIPIAANKIKSEPETSNIIESEYKPIEKRYKCSVEGCDRAFKVPYGLKRHSWVHTKVKPFECDKCMKRFLRKDHLSKHMKTHSRIPIIKYPKNSANKYLLE